MGICINSSDQSANKKRNEKRTDPTIIRRIEETKKTIFKMGVEISQVENKINSLKDEISKEEKKQKEENCSNEVKINDLNRDLMCEILKHERLLKNKNALKNNLNIMENKNEENILINELDKNNEILDNIDDGNGEVIQQNNFNVRGQNDQMNLNMKLLDEGDIMKDVDCKAIINKYINPTKK